MSILSWSKGSPRPVAADAAAEGGAARADRGAGVRRRFVLPDADASARHAGRWAADRHDRADADADPDADAGAGAGAGAGADRHESEVVVLEGDRADADRADADRGADERADVAQLRVLRRHWADSPRCASEPLGSLHELLVFAQDAHYNFSHINFVRAANLVFFWMVTAPVLIIAWPFLWAYVIRFHRALTAWGLTFLVAPPANAFIDVAVPDKLVWTAWPIGVWQVVAGFVLVFLLATVVVVRRWR